MKLMKYIKGLVIVGAVLSGVMMTSCEDEPDKYEIADGLPTVNYIRMTDPEVADSLITGAYMSNTICLVGENLRSVYELYFNDQKAILNTSLITDNTLIVDIPSTIPSVVTNKIYLINKNHETVIIRKSKFPLNPERSVQISGKRTKRSVQKKAAHNTYKAGTKG